MKELLRLGSCTVVNYCCCDSCVTGTLHGRKDLGSQCQRVTVMVRKVWQSSWWWKLVAEPPHIMVNRKQRIIRTRARL